MPDRRKNMGWSLTVHSMGYDTQGLFVQDFPPCGKLPGMPHHEHSAHIETHFESSDVVRDVVIGMADGLTVPFALAAGLSGVGAATHVVVIAGLAEIAAGSIAMGLGGYLASRGDSEHYASERRREEMEVVERTRDEEEEIYGIFEEYGVTRAESDSVLQALKRNPKAWVDFMMRFELGLEEPEVHRARQSAITIAFSYIVGGLVPLLPYMLMDNNARALAASVVITLVALAIFGAVKGRFTGAGIWRSGLQTVSIGGLAAAAAYALARVFHSH